MSGKWKSNWLRQVTALGRERPVDLTVPSGGDRQFPIMPIRVAYGRPWLTPL
jgi:hypothetical protein